MTHPSRLAFPVALAVLAGGGTSASSASQPLGIDRELPLEEGGSLSIFNVAGLIRVEAWDKDMVRLRAERTGPGAGRIEVRIETAPGRLEVRTIHPAGGTENSGCVTYHIQAPRTRLRELRLENVSGDIQASGVEADGFRLRTVSGALSLTGSSGFVDAATVSGHASLSLTPSEPAWRCRLKTVSGELALRLPKGAGARLTASTVSGRTWVPEGDAQGLRNGTTTFGDGRGQIDLETVSGDCRVTCGE